MTPIRFIGQEAAKVIESQLTGMLMGTLMGAVLLRLTQSAFTQQRTLTLEMTQVPTIRIVRRTYTKAA